MIQYYLDLEKQLIDIKEKRLSQGQIQKIYSTAYYISLAVRAPGKTWHIYLGRGSGFEGVWLGEAPPPSELRRRDNFLEYFRRHLSACSFLNLKLDSSDRIVQLDYQKFGAVQSLLLFWKGRKLYFLHYYQETPEAPFKLMLSWGGKAFVPGSELKNLFEYFDDVGRKEDMKHDLRSQSDCSILELLNEEKKAASLLGMTSNPTFLQRKKDNIEDDLRKAKQWDKIQNLLDQGLSLDMYELKIGDHKMKFEGNLNQFERRNLLFQKIKKLKRGEGILSERLKTVTEQLAGKSTENKKVSQLPLCKPIWGVEEKSVTAPTKSHAVEAKGYKLFKFELCQIGVGLTSQGNDQLRNEWASKEDMWLHLDGIKSAHVVIKTVNNRALESESLNLGASILAEFSQYQDDWIPIIFTQVKNLKGVTGAPGMVIYKKEKHLRCPRVPIN